MKRKSGMTLLELTVVILVLLSLISILFIGARAWKKGSDRAGCILNIRNVQQAMRGHANMHSLLEGTGVVDETIIYGAAGDGVGAYLRKRHPCPTLISRLIQAAPHSGRGRSLAVQLLTPATGLADYAPPAELTADW